MLVDKYFDRTQSLVQSSISEKLFRESRDLGLV